MLKDLQVDKIDKTKQTDINGNLAGESPHWLKESEMQTGYLAQSKRFPIIKIKYKNL
ncbi:MAG: hypothetical protein JST15_11155 [Bacteroidetes bacterium]|nr:hypothetical protein [Bacteroidota bacterium]